MTSLLPCPSCGCHAKRDELLCLECGAPLGDRPRGASSRTAAAVLLGLTALSASAAGSACGSEVDIPDKGTGSVAGAGGASASGTGGSGGASSMSATTGIGGFGGFPSTVVSSSNGSTGAAIYGVAATDDDGDGWFAGGKDCDDADASVHPGAPDPPGDGLDTDCDGEDG